MGNQKHTFLSLLLIVGACLVFALNSRAGLNEATIVGGSGGNGGGFGSSTSYKAPLKNETSIRAASDAELRGAKWSISSCGWPDEIYCNVTSSSTVRVHHTARRKGNWHRVVCMGGYSGFSPHIHNCFVAKFMPNHSSIDPTTLTRVYFDNSTSGDAPVMGEIKSNPFWLPINVGDDIAITGWCNGKVGFRSFEHAGQYEAGNVATKTAKLASLGIYDHGWVSYNFTGIETLSEPCKNYRDIFIVSDSLLTYPLYTDSSFVDRLAQVANVYVASKSSTGFEDQEPTFYKRLRPGLMPDTAIVCISRMDTTRIQEMRVQLLSMMAAMKRLGMKVILTTIPPKNSFTADSNKMLKDFNAWQMGLPGGADGIFDLNTLWYDPANPDNFLASLGDGTHPYETGTAAAMNNYARTSDATKNLLAARFDAVTSLNVFVDASAGQDGLGFGFSAGTPCRSLNFAVKNILPTGVHPYKVNVYSKKGLYSITPNLLNMSDREYGGGLNFFGSYTTHLSVSGATFTATKVKKAGAFSSTPDAHKGQSIYIVDGTGAGQLELCKFSTMSTLTPADCFGTVPSGSTVELRSARTRWDFGGYANDVINYVNSLYIDWVKFQNYGSGSAVRNMSGTDLVTLKYCEFAGSTNAIGISGGGVVNPPGGSQVTATGCYFHGGKYAAYKKISLNDCYVRGNLDSPNMTYGVVTVAPGDYASLTRTCIEGTTTAGVEVEGGMVSLASGGNTISGTPYGVYVKNHAQVLGITNPTFSTIGTANYFIETGSSTASLSSDVTMTNAGTWYDGPSVSLSPGVYFISANVTVRGTSTASDLEAKLWDGATIIASIGTHTDNLNDQSSISLSGIATVLTTATWKVSCVASLSGGATIKASTYETSTSNASTITAMRLF